MSETLHWLRSFAMKMKTKTLAWRSLACRCARGGCAVALVVVVLLALATSASAGGAGVFHGADGSRGVLGEPVRLGVVAEEGGRCLSAFWVDRFGARMPAGGVKFRLDERRRVFSVSGRVCPYRGWRTAQAVWRVRVFSRVLVNERAPGPVLVVGHLTALTGPLSYFGESQSRAASLAADHLNRVGGAAGAPVVVVDRDSEVDPSRGVEAARALLEQDSAAAILGASASGVTIAVAEQVTVPAGVLQVSGSSTAPAITTLEDDDFLFRTALSDAAQGVVLADLAVELGYETAGVLYIDNPYGQGLAARFVEAFTARGGTVTAVVAHGDSQPSYVAELEEATRGHPGCAGRCQLPAGRGVSAGGRWRAAMRTCSCSPTRRKPRRSSRRSAGSFWRAATVPALVLTRPGRRPGRSLMPTCPSTGRSRPSRS